MKFDLYWSPTGTKITEVNAKDEKQAIKKTPAPFNKYKGEIYAIKH